MRLAYKPRTRGKMADVVVIALLGLTSAGSQAMAAMAPEVYAEMLAAAPYHVQVQVTDRRLIPAPASGQQAQPTFDPWRGTCTLSGMIDRVFRDATNDLEIGEPISVEVPCEHEGALELVGGIIFSDVEALRAAAYVEVIVDGPPGGPYAVAGQGKGIAIMDAPSDAPVIGTQP